MKLSRREFLKLSAAAGASLVIPWQFNQPITYAAQSPQLPLAPNKIPQFVDPLPTLASPGGIASTTGNSLEISMQEFESYILPTGTFGPGVRTKTWVWGYRLGQAPVSGTPETYLGPAIIATRGAPTEIKFLNNLKSGADTNVLAWKYSSDQTLHWADPLNDEMNMWNHMAMPPAVGSAGAQNYAGPIPGVVHLHGGEVPPVLDGGPDAWVTSDGLKRGHGFYSKDGATTGNYHIYRYPNSQEASMIWFHDHALGATRLNVYAGLAGAYPIIDPTLTLPAGLTAAGIGTETIVPLIIQDRMFDTNGQLFFPADSVAGLQWAPNPDHPYWVPEFVGDVICVNGKAWPFLNVQAKRYRFLFLNGSNARTYELFLVNPVTKVMGPPLWQIGTDGGYLDSAVKIDPNTAANNKLTIMPGERADVIIDFAGLAGQTLIMRNTGRTPYPKGTAPNGSTTGQILQFRVGTGPAVDAGYNPATGGAIRPNGRKIIRLVNPTTGALAVTAQKTRQLTLNEVMGMPQNAINPVTGVMTAYPGGPLEILVNNTKWSGERVTGVANGHYVMGTRSDFQGVTLNGVTTYYSEVPNEGETEVWEIVNLTADAHPMHTHLATFQLLNRQNFNTGNYLKAYAAAFPGGGYDPMTQLPYAAGVFIPGFGPPLHYTTGNARALGGNPDVTPFLQGPVQPPLPQEAGWKDTIMTPPGMVTRFVVRFAPTDTPVDTLGTYPFDPNAGNHGYVWHCHIIDHEDNEMMRPSKVNPKPGAVRTFNQGTQY
ncbi:MAG: multicopper oxidase domain-containing protein [Chloroflexi bacterium]|nr:multicopper oxidase domain-containing protein [Chloroflexota bacterium]